MHIVFSNKFIGLFNVSFPLRKYPKHANVNNCYQSDASVIECKRRLDILYTVSFNNPAYKELYKQVKKEYNKKLTIAKHKKFQDKIDHSTNKAQTVWNIVNEINGVGKKRDEIKINGEPKCIANDFNNFLTESIKCLTSKFQGNQYKCNFLDNNKSMFVKPVTSREIVEIVGKFKNKMSSGDDEIPTKIVKKIIEYIAEPLTHIINNSLKNGIFPDKLKTALVVPIYKKGDPSSLENYRPISILSAFSKVFEAIMCERLISFFKFCSLLNPNQHGYIKGKSTYTAIFQFTQHILEILENKDIPMGIYLDLSKAYDCLDHDILLVKLEKYGIRGQALSWFKSYLSERPRKVVVKKEEKTEKSDVAVTNIGVPQGSILGPVLFVIYLNDLGNVKEVNNITLMTSYADDTNFIINASNWVLLQNKTNKCMQIVEDWFYSNKQILNTEKTSLMLFKTSSTHSASTQSTILNGKNITISQNAKFLGLHIDSNLNWDVHVTKTCEKLTSTCYSMIVLSKYVNITTLKTVYYSNFQSKLRYGIIFYGSCNSLNRIFIIQKRILRIMTRTNKLTSCRGKFRNLGILTVPAVYIIECLIFLFKNRELFIKQEPARTGNGRLLNYVYPKHRLTLYEKGTLYSTIKFFNKLPMSIKTCKHFISYKKQIYELLVSLEPYNIQEYLNAVI